MQYSTARIWAAFGLFISVTTLATALYFQISKEWLPCPLCIMQRYAYLVSALGFLGIALTSRKGLVSGAFTLLGLAGVLGGISMAFYHVWVLSNPSQTCGVDPLQITLNALPWVQVWPEMFMSDGLCSEEYPPLFGLSLPMWSGIGFLVQGLVLLITMKARRYVRSSW